MFPEPRCWKSEIKLSAGPCSRQSLLGRICPRPFSQLLGAASHPWHPLACRHITPLFTSVITWSSPGCLHVCMSQRPLLIRIPITGLRASTWLHLQRPYFQIKYGRIHRSCGLGLARIFGRDRIQPSALWVHHSQLTSTRVRLSGSKAEARRRKGYCFLTVFE